MGYLFTVFEQKESNFYVGANWKEKFGDVEFFIFHEGECYDGVVSVKDFQKLSSQVKLEVHEYWNQSQLIWNNHSKQRKDLEIKPNDSDPSLLSFMWKRVLPNNPIKQRLGTINLKKSGNKGNNFLDFLVKNVNQQKQSIEKLNDELQNLTRNYEGSLKTLEDLSNVKESVETNLFSKFVAVLNQKKEKIRSMMEKLEDKESGSSNALDNSRKRNRKSKMPTKRKRVQSSDDDSNIPRNYETDTDDEKLETPEPADRRSNCGSVSTADEMDISYRLEEEDMLAAHSSKVIDDLSDIESDKSDQLIILNECSSSKMKESDEEEATQELTEQSRDVARNFTSLSLMKECEEVESYIKFLRDRGLLATVMNCEQCNGECNELKDNSRIDKVYWRCSKCKAKKSIRHASIFWQSKLQLKTVLMVLHCWAKDMPMSKAAKECDVTKKIVIDWYHFCRQMCADHSNEKIGGAGHTVEVDESTFFKAKHNRRLYGGIDRDTRKIFLCEVPDRTSEKLLQATLEHIELGTTIITDQWEAYNVLLNAGLEHYTISHQNFVNPVMDAHTEMVEAVWSKAKKKFKAMNGADIEMRSTYFAEFVWKENLKNSDLFESFLSMISRIFVF